MRGIQIDPPRREADESNVDDRQEHHDDRDEDQAKLIKEGGPCFGDATDEAIQNADGRDFGGRRIDRLEMQEKCLRRAMWAIDGGVIGFGGKLNGIATLLAVTF